MREPGANDELLSLIIVSTQRDWLTDTTMINRLLRSMIWETNYLGINACHVMIDKEGRKEGDG